MEIASREHGRGCHFVHIRAMLFKGTRGIWNGNRFGIATLVPIPIGTDHEVPCRQMFVICMHALCSMSFLFMTTKCVNMYHVLNLYTTFLKIKYRKIMEQVMSRVRLLA